MTTMNAAIAALCVMSLPAVALAEAEPVEAVEPGPEPAMEAAEPDETDPPELVTLYEAVQPAVVRIHTREGAGAGFLIAPDRIATAWHVVDVRHDLRVETLDGQLIAVDVITRDKKQDLAVLALPEPLTVEGQPVTPLALRDETPPVGTQVVALGHPLSDSEDRKKGPIVGLLNWSMTEGIVSQVGETSVQTTAAVECGNSGGPLLDYDGDVVGVVTLKAGSVGAATRVEHLRTLRDEPASLPKGPTVELHGRYGLGVTGMAGQPTRTGTFITLSTGLEVVLDRKLMLGFSADVDMLASKKARNEDKMRATRLSLMAEIGPRLELPFKAKKSVPFGITPYFTAGVGMARQGTHEQTLRFTDPNCDPFTQDCSYEASSGTNWGPNRWMPQVGGGLRVDVAGTWFGVQATTNPGAPEQDTRVIFGFGLRF